MNIALIAHDEKKGQIVDLAIASKDILEKHKLYATGTTGLRLIEATGPLGGDQQIGALISTGGMDLVIFLRDPLTVQPHEPDVSALIRLCDVHNTPLATNMGTAAALLRGLRDGYFDNMAIN